MNKLKIEGGVATFEEHHLSEQTLNILSVFDFYFHTGYVAYEDSEGLPHKEPVISITLEFNERENVYKNPFITYEGVVFQGLYPASNRIAFEIPYKLRHEFFDGVVI